MCTSDTWLCPPLVTNPQGKLEGLTKGERNRDCGCSVRTPQQASKKPLEDKKASHSRPHRPRQRETSRKTCLGSTCILSRPPHLQRSLAACHFLLRITKQASKQNSQAQRTRKVKSRHQGKTFPWLRVARAGSRSFARPLSYLQRRGGRNAAACTFSLSGRNFKPLLVREESLRQLFVALRKTMHRSTDRLPKHYGHRPFS